MKLKTALRYANEIAVQLKSTNGFIYTPLHDRPAIKIKRLWLFGSSAKGKLNPNDVDILAEVVEVGDRYDRTKRGTWVVDKDFYRRFGMSFAKSSISSAFKQLKNRRKMVNIHATEWVDVEIDIKILLYPRNDLIDTSR